MTTVRFWRDHGAREVGRGTTLMAAAQRSGAPLGNACHAQGICRACAVLVLAGSELLDEPGPLERQMGLDDGWRMACQTRVDKSDDGAEVRIWIPAWGGWPESESE